MLCHASRATVRVRALGFRCAPSWSNGETDRTLIPIHGGGYLTPPSGVMRCMALRCMALRRKASGPGAESTDHPEPKEEARSPEQA